MADGLQAAGLKVIVTDDGTWLEFSSTDGKRAAINIEALADQKQAGLARAVSEALTSWCRDRRQGRAYHRGGRL
jgi:hypothetical protein